MNKTENMWTERNSKFFIEHANNFIPERDLQIETICSLIGPSKKNKQLVVDLCCGEGLLDEAILRKYSNINVIGLDGSEEMLSIAKERLRRFESRIFLASFDLASKKWRPQYKNLHAVVSSIAIHHLTGQEKLQLYKDVYTMLKPKGRFIIGDIICLQQHQEMIMLRDNGII